MKKILILVLCCTIGAGLCAALISTGLLAFLSGIFTSMSPITAAIVAVVISIAAFGVSTLGVPASREEWKVLVAFAFGLGLFVGVCNYLSASTGLTAARHVVVLSLTAAHGAVYGLALGLIVGLFIITM